MRRPVAWIVVLLAVMFMFSCASFPLVRASWALPWGVERIHAQCVWDNNNDKTIDPGANVGDNVTIAVIDTGVFYYVEGGVKHYHPDLEDNIVGGCTFTYMGQYVDVDRGYYCDTPMMHGTHVTGTIAATGNDGGLIGVSPRAKIYALKCASVYNYPPDTYAVAMEVAAAINWAIGPECNCSIISISLGWNDYFDEVYQACLNAYEHGVLIVAAAGDDGNGPVIYPAAFSGLFDTVVAVGDTYPNDSRYEDCNCGPELSFMAPGVNINSTIWDGFTWGYGSKTGSSMAVPHVTGAAALIFKSKIDPYYDLIENGKWDGCEVVWELAAYSLSLGNFTEYGWGLVNPWESTQRPEGDVNNNLKVDIVDVAIVSGSYGSYFPDHPKWRARADINIDNKVDITDLAITQANFGKFDP